MTGFDLITRTLLVGAEITVTVSVIGTILAMIVGYVFCLIREFSESRYLSIAITSYCEYFRNIPAITHVFVIYFGLAQIGIKLSSIMAAIVAFGCIGGAVCCDIFRGGFQALPRGQMEAAQAVGFRPLQSIGVVLTPQAFRISLPPLINYALQLMKDTSVISAIAAPEIVFRAQSLNSQLFQPTLIFGTAAMIYIILSLPIVWLAHTAERASNRNR